jgi:hypothetical protein
LNHTGIIRNTANLSATKLRIGTTQETILEIIDPRTRNTSA